MNFCSNCGAKLIQQIPADDNRLRHVCPECDVIHYVNPKVVVGCLPIAGDQVLLCRRAIAPRIGSWTIPAGFMENGETMLDGALRETLEEAAAKVKDEVLYRLFDIPHINQVYVFYRGNLDGDFGVGPESLESKLFSEADIPWSELAFPIVTDVLTEYFEDRKTGQYPIRVSTPSPLWAKQVGWKPNTKKTVDE
ncbi:NUDIX hydrolase [gamma proteobacterium BDW918]|uniref:ADP-ribose pyrophosphatase n=1 Tax=Zhongshania aliphaticivorans TaxID=1470434 RepID=A0A127M4T6_9GAMM|nr:NUDIX hydrolase [Zhongshania aliphaticivorans]AMO68255.1 ADP-ribose pyrophosphatase [Zhongshania aliphaticivorans]EIF44148.1 NUDIX hydrolase [gamma proteobacterium BDW918]